MAKNKKYFLVVSVLLLIIPSFALAQDCSVSGNTISFCNPLRFNSVEGVLGSLLNSLQGIIVTLAIVFIVIGAVLYVTSAGDEKRITTAKHAITAALIGLALGIAAPSFLKEIYTILGSSPVQDCNNLPNPTQDAIDACNEMNKKLNEGLPLIQIVLNVLNFLLSVFGTLALIMLVVGGLMYLTAGGDEKRIDTGKKTVKFAVIGIVVCLSALVIVKQIAKFFT